MTDIANPLALLPAKVRQGLYVGYGCVVIVTGAIQVGYAAIPGIAQPLWLTVVQAVVTFLGVPISALAATNVRRVRLAANAARHEEQNELTSASNLG